MTPDSKTDFLFKKKKGIFKNPQIKNSTREKTKIRSALTKLQNHLRIRYKIRCHLNRAMADARKAWHTLQWRTHKCKTGPIKTISMWNTAKYCVLAKEAAPLGWILMFLTAEQIGWVLIKEYTLILEVVAWEKESYRGVSSSHRFLLKLWIFCKWNYPKQTHLCVLCSPSLAGLGDCEQEIYCASFYITITWNIRRAGIISALHNHLTGYRGQL